VTPAEAWRAAAAIPGRARRGRPARITARAIAAAAVATTAALGAAGTPAAPANIAAAALWFAITSQPELAPPASSEEGKQKVS
jgi:hypothetical protein